MPPELSAAQAATGANRARRISPARIIPFSWSARPAWAGRPLLR